ncbi:glycerophosphoryl diester phosphodiesterase membrane domain-containing protein [Lactobacillus hominis]|uniref:Glycerophosphodiester phosphodiesterase n=1 Tax=Lactobacillus hominis DSM 23910 = CRBIP 24.179 TaxID=1423758 RepID=I7L6I6_9LACO|nr:glycerophosphodiester phosphodiesterase [Lactobacillus hominis]KRM84519.1 membrane domain of membrane-anchored glycerophosphoryl diester phosphodiesterase [Lactobacillus hominis DSM 23910 = CRBIP 24.179]MCT3348382.1 glycerophosphodiester phosphodiesterase [Lactobacillus hominis]CCI82037.1 Glycerophosphodiester phosphodiesterase [Lactobacillus hominis DSM 23910 = CRBIP 24.179]
MKNIYTEIKNDSAIFKKYWLRFLLLFVSLDLFNQIIVIPLFRWAATYILQAGAIPFISYQNIMTILTTHTLVVIALLLELVLLILVIYLQFAFMLVAVRYINCSLKLILKRTWQAMKHLRFGSLLVLLAYFLLVVPFVDLVFRTPLLAKIQIPEFILDYMTRNLWLSLALIAFYLITFILGIRWIYTLPLMVFNKMKTRQAIRQSWQKTKNLNWWKILSILLVIGIISVIVLVICFGLIYGLQVLCDFLPKTVSLILANFNLLLVQLVSLLVSVWSSVLAFLFILKNLKIEILTKTNHKNKGVIAISSVIFVIFAAMSIINNQFYLNGQTLRRPVTISHRGVNNKNGVQNTIPALKKTAKLHPDFVEIDVHETKDNQFVVMHDENLLKLAGINKMPKDLTLKQLTQITLHEDNHRAKIASFDQYLAAAKKLKQRLLIEIKTTPRDSKKIINRFNKKYGSLILKRKYQVQSLDYSVIERLHKINPRIFTLYIQPYNFTYPQSVADGYSMEYSTLNNDFIWQAHLKHDLVYAWTVNDDKIMRKMMFEGVDGIITDNLAGLKETIHDFEDDHSYSSRLLNYILVLPQMNTTM